MTLAPEAQQTVSQALAQAEGRTLVESRLWQRLTTTFQEAEVPCDDDAPDFVCAASAPPPVGVFRVAQEPEETDAPPAPAGVFEAEEDDDSDDEEDDEEEGEE